MTDFQRTAELNDDGVIVIRAPDLSNNALPLPSWTRRYTLTVFPSPDALVNFPVLVKLNAENFDFSAAQADGSDIRFSLLDNPTHLDWLASEVDEYDGATTGKIWVKLPLIKSGDANTTFHLFCGNVAAGDVPAGVFSAYQFALHGDDGQNWLVPLTSATSWDRSEQSGRHFTIWPIADVRDNFEAVDATGLEKATATLLIEAKCSDPAQILDSLPHEIGDESTEHDHEGYQWVGGIGISSTDLESGGPIEEWWREGIRDLGFQREWHLHEVPLSDWINRSAESLDGSASTESTSSGTAWDGDNTPNGNGSGKIIGDGTSWNSDITAGDRVMVRFSRPQNEKIFKVEEVISNTKIHVQGYAEDNVGDNVGLNFHDRTMWLCNNDDDLEVDSIQHLRMVGHFRSHNVQLFYRNARLTWLSESTNVVPDAAGNCDAIKTVPANITSTAGGTVGNALSMNLTAGRIQFSRYLDTGGASFTMSCWVKTATGCTSIPTLGSDDLRMRFDNDYTFFLQFGKFRRTFPFAPNLFDMNWHHIAIVRDRAKNFFKVWIDGALALTHDDAGKDFNISGFSYFVGDEEADTAESFAGLIDEARLIFEAKGESWITNEYNAVAASIVAIGDAYVPELLPDGVILETDNGGTVYVT